MRYVIIRLTDEEFEKLEKLRNGISKQRYCFKKIFGEDISQPDFENEAIMGDENPEFYFNVHFKLSPRERDMLDRLKGDMSIQEFCRLAVLNAKIVKLDELQQLTYHMSKIGNNINQIAKIANQTKHIGNDSVNDLLKTLNELSNEVVSLKNEIVKRVV